MSRKKKILFSLLVVFLSLVLIEAVLRVGGNRKLITLEDQKTSESYINKPWADQYFADRVACGKQRRDTATPYTRYVLHGGAAKCATETINYDGPRRKTWNPSPDSVAENSKTYRVAFFGGSTTQGTGTIDDLTIPSHFSKLVNAEANGNGIYYFVENYGVASYTFTQSLMKLILLLREGERFDHVIFYSGANDIDNAYDAGEAGALFAERELKMKLSGSTSEKFKEFLRGQVWQCATCQALVIIARNTPVVKDYVMPVFWRVKDAVFPKGGQALDEGGVRFFAEDIASYYVDSHELLDALSRAYGFKYAEFWQPALLYEASVLGGENIILDADSRLSDEKLRELYRLTLENLNSKEIENFYDISDSLVDRKEAYYLDAVHISGEGNGDVARKMFELVGGELPGTL